MSRSYTVIEKSQTPGLGRGAGWWYVLQGKFDTMAPLTLVDQTGTITLKESPPVPVTVTDAQVSNGVLSIRLDGVDGHLVGRPATLTIGLPA